LPGERILVIDDSEEIRTVLRETILEPRGYRVATAPDGQKGLAYALREKPDLILSDVNMPNMTGLEVLEKLREARYEWPVILMTFHGSEDIAVQAFRLGVRDYIRKPFEVQEVISCVERTLIESMLRREREDLLQKLEATNRQLNRKVAELTTMYAIGQAVTAVLDLDTLLNRIVEASVYLCQADEGSLYLIDRESGELRMTAAQSAGEKNAHRVSLKVTDSLIGQVVRSKKPAIVTSRTLDPELKTKGGYVVHSLVEVPLRVKDQVIGILGVANRDMRRDFAREDMTRLCALANYAAIAIENARLYDATRKVIAAEVLHNVAVTISHYINNPLMAVMMNVDRLVQVSRDGETANWDDRLAATALFTEMKVEEISAVISILRDVASPTFVTYMDDIRMIDIEKRVQERLHQIKEKYKE
jgi:two-component system NtrC family sensor kinase